MSITIRHRTRRGGSCIRRTQSLVELERVLRACHRDRLEATAINDLGAVIGEAYRIGSEGWIWWYDREPWQVPAPDGLRESDEKGG